MPELLVHILLPLLIMCMVGIELRKAIILSLFAILPDFDIFFGVHRSASHSILFILSIGLPLIMVTYIKKSKLYKYLIIVILVVLSHVFLDMFTGYTPIFWPLYNKSIYIVSNMTVNTVHIYNIKIYFHIYTKPVTFYLEDVDAPVFTNQGIALLTLFLVGVFLKSISQNR